MTSRSARNMHANGEGAGAGMRHEITIERKCRIIERIRCHSSPKLCWTDVVRISADDRRPGFSRQALAQDPDIAAAYRAKKQALRESKSCDRHEGNENPYETLKRKYAEVCAEHTRLVEQISRMQINATLARIDLNKLEEPLPPMHIESSDVSKFEREHQERKRDRNDRAQCLSEASIRVAGA